MEKIKKLLKNNFLTIYIILNICYIFLGSFYVIGLKGQYSYFGLSMIYAFFINLFVLIGLIIKKKKKYKITIYDILLLLCAFFVIIACIFAINKKVAIYGSINRYEGVYALLYYLTLTYLSSFVPKKDKKYIVKVIIATGIFQAIYGLLQALNVPFVTVVTIHDKLWKVGLTNNPNFFGTYMLLSISYTLGLLIDTKKFKEQLIYTGIMIILLIGLLLSECMSCIIAFIVVLIYVFIYCYKNKKLKDIIEILVVIACIFIIFFTTFDNNLSKDINKTKDESISLVQGKKDIYFGTRRFGVWQETLKVVPKHLVHGAGIDNFLFAFGNRPLILKKYVYDKAHNEYLQILLTEGIFSLICYLALYSIILINGIKNSFKNKQVYLVLPVLGYLIQAFFNISVIEVAPIFYIALGLLIERDNKKRRKKND